jgi:hypothetical protein
MKIKVILSGLILFIGVGGAFAQEVEQDDMYFNAKDRAKLRAAQKTSEVAYASVKKSKKSESAEEDFNPTDSYSARNVNPEYTSRSSSQTAKADDEDYFVSNYKYNQQSNYNNWNNSFNNWYGNPWYAPNYWGAGINSWNTPYYGSYYDSWGSPWSNPYYQSGWSSGFSYHRGNSWNYGWSMGFGNCWSCNSYYNSWNPYYGYASNWNSPYYNNWGGYYPTRVIVVESADRYNHAYGKRPVRGSSIVSDRSNNSRSRSGVVTTPERNNAPNGRISNSGRTQNEYYNRSWRNGGSDNSAPAPSYDSRSSTQNNRSSSWNNNNNSSDNSWNRSSNSSYTPARSSGSFENSGSSGTRNHSSSGSGSSGSNGRSRGRD